MRPAYRFFNGVPCRYRRCCRSCCYCRCRCLSACMPASQPACLPTYLSHTRMRTAFWWPAIARCRQLFSIQPTVVRTTSLYEFFPYIRYTSILYIYIYQSTKRTYVARFLFFVFTLWTFSWAHSFIEFMTIFDSCGEYQSRVRMNPQCNVNKVYHNANRRVFVAVSPTLLVDCLLLVSGLCCVVRNSVFMR